MIANGNFHLAGRVCWCDEKNGGRDTHFQNRLLDNEV